MKNLLPIISTILFFASSTSQAGGLFLEGGIHTGGDDLITVNFSGGGSESIEAGGLISLSAGWISDINEDMEVRTSAGIKFDSVDADNGDLDFTRYPVSLMLFSKGEKVSAGIGATYHLGPKFESSGFTGNFTIDFDDALGFVAEIDFKLGEKAYLGLLATVIDYEVSNAFGSATVDGNSVGLVIGLRF
jgi:hypothetical protein